MVEALALTLYKIFFKSVSLRIKEGLTKGYHRAPLVFCERPSYFFNNILAIFETLHCMRTHNSSKFGCMSLKLDMSKAYDKVEWAFLENLMRRMGFNDHWINLIVFCLKTGTYSILVNGEPKGLIHPSRGIIQGDPLCPFFFSLLY